MDLILPSQGRGDRRRSSVLDEILETKKRNEKLMFALAEKAPSFLQVGKRTVDLCTAVRVLTNPIAHVTFPPAQEQGC
eukprot:1392459-Amorphochlora_amoeboformis.AAC.3